MSESHQDAVDAAAQLWDQMSQANEARKAGRLLGRDFEDVEADLAHRMMDLVLARAEELWPRAVAKDWMVGSNEFLSGARPLDVLRMRGPQDVFDALAAEAQGAIG